MVIALDPLKKVTILNDIDPHRLLLFRERLSYGSLKMPYGVMGSGILPLLDRRSRCLSAIEGDSENMKRYISESSFFRTYITVNFDQAAVTITTHDNFRYCRLRFCASVEQPFSHT